MKKKNKECEAQNSNLYLYSQVRLASIEIRIFQEFKVFELCLNKLFKACVKNFPDFRIKECCLVNFVLSTSNRFLKLMSFTWSMNLRLL